VTPPLPPDPESIDLAHALMARRRRLREAISMICAGVFVTAMVVAFYRILTS
jgi:hypothetical protein